MTHKTHAPGPWKIRTKPRSSSVQVIIADAKEFCPEYLVTLEPKVASKDFKIANARLIAAAPELLEALQAYILAVEEERELDDHDLHNKCRAAIAKATGAA